MDKKTSKNYSINKKDTTKKRLLLIDNYKSKDYSGIAPETNPIPDDFSDCITVAQLAAKLNLSTRTIERAIAKKEIFSHKIGKSVRIPISAVETWLSERSNKPR